ncbi:alkaline phosphatase D [Pseudomonas sp. SORGH_AS199]|uniref:alkaline phosphatase D family protein n=1 Tax=Pseudomonas TaxID=286 RepID=UPI00165E417A|nr:MULTISPECIES: alkaline phosphatase D family protein [Pseudomonas]MDK8265360.1 alkaline phosphatase D family protein [Pseudomonas oryzihabitans]MDR6229548.1 alkaline phosphatase D [Pseudomonas sp. SORGH_AS_0199]QNQ98732.1 alkaline phosphatase [Pseudomonas psychrotolerans]
MSTSRRQALGLLGLGLSAPWFAGCSARTPQPDPFTLGVASGDPATDGFVIWTRLAPDPLAEDGLGGLHGPVKAGWEVALDPGLRQVVQRGVIQAQPQSAFCLSIPLTGLLAGRPYWYRFTALGHQSRIGRATTLPPSASAPQRLKLVAASCSHYEKGFFSAYRHMADEQADLALFLGDYIYEANVPLLLPAVRRHGLPEARDLASYRRRHALYRTDPDLQYLHANVTSLMTWDDHEVQNDYSGPWAADPRVSLAAFAARRQAAYQAFREHAPLRGWRTQGSALRLYDRWRFGDLAEIHLLDGRQYRSEPACTTPRTRGGQLVAPDCPGLRDAARSMLGQAQERWLLDGFRHNATRWNLIAQDLLLAPLRQRLPEGDPARWTDGWDGYPATRERLLAAMADSRLANPVTLGGDIHSFWVTDLHREPEDERSPVVASEFVGTSITSDGPDYRRFQALLPENPQVRFFDSRERGYLALELTRERLQVDLRTISDRTRPDAGRGTRASFVVEAGRPGAVPA